MSRVGGAGASGPGDTARRRLEAIVSGRVHGVGFRAFVLREARSLGLGGWVANEPDGTVRVVVEGPTAACEAFVVALRAGPPASVVTGLSLSWLADTGLGPGFEIRSGWHRGD